MPDFIDTFETSGTIDKGGCSGEILRINRQINALKRTGKFDDETEARLIDLTHERSHFERRLENIAEVKRFTTVAKS